jgi:hypothetical protein
VAQLKNRNDESSGFLGRVERVKDWDTETLIGIAQVVDRLVGKVKRSGKCENSLCDQGLLTSPGMAVSSLPAVNLPVSNLLRRSA